MKRTDVLLIGSGIMSSTLGALLKLIDPQLSIQLYEMSDQAAQESSNGWNNAGTGHAGICELSYTPNMEADGTVNVKKAISVFDEFEYSLQFWAYCASQGILKQSRNYINPVPHISLVYSAEQVRFLQARFDGLKKHHFFRDMEFTTDKETIASWAPLLVEGRSEKQPIAATKMDAGTDVNFGEVASNLIDWLAQQDACSVNMSHRIIDLEKDNEGWKVTIRNQKTNEVFSVHSKFVFIGAGGGALPLLQKSGIPEIRGYGGFPVGGQWMISEVPEVVEKHHAKVYGQPAGAAPTMAVPHLDTRIINGKKVLLFGPFASWTTKFLHNGGSWLDLPTSIRSHNIATLASVGIHNLDLVKYLVEQGLQSKESRMEELRHFYPDARSEDWQVIDAGIRVQAIKQNPGEKPGIVHYGTEIVTNTERNLCALLGASPGASVSVHVMFACIRQCFPDLFNSSEAQARMSEMLPQWNDDWSANDKESLFHEKHLQALQQLDLI